MDYLLGWDATRLSIENGTRLGILHNAASIAIYAWPIAVSVIAVRTGHHSLRDIPTNGAGTRPLVRGTLCLILVLCVILAGAALPSVALYRTGHAALEILTLFMYLFTVARPHLLSRARLEIRETQEKSLKLNDDETRFILERPDRSVLDIAMDVGYGSRAVFNSQFMRIVGMCPSEYRRTASRR